MVRKIELHLSSGQVSLVFLVQLLTLLVLWASWKELKEQVCYIACPEKCAEELCAKGLLIQGTHTCPTEKITCLG